MDESLERQSCRNRKKHQQGWNACGRRKPLSNLTRNSSPPNSVVGRQLRQRRGRRRLHLGSSPGNPHNRSAARLKSIRHGLELCREAWLDADSTIRMRPEGRGAEDGSEDHLDKLLAAAGRGLRLGDPAQPAARQLVQVLIPRALRGIELRGQLGTQPAATTRLRSSLRRRSAPCLASRGEELVPALEASQPTSRPSREGRASQPPRLCWK